MSNCIILFFIYSFYFYSYLKELVHRGSFITNLQTAKTSKLAIMNHDEIVILDFGSQYSHLIARRVRGMQYRERIRYRAQCLL